jgi:hypothetical protein
MKDSETEESPPPSPAIEHGRYARHRLKSSADYGSGCAIASSTAPSSGDNTLRSVFKYKVPHPRGKKMPRDPSATLRAGSLRSGRGIRGCAIKCKTPVAG